MFILGSRNNQWAISWFNTLDAAQILEGSNIETKSSNNTKLFIGIKKNLRILWFDGNRVKTTRRYCINKTYMWMLHVEPPNHSI